MIPVRYAVSILNYNTIDDAINAAKSVIDNAVAEEYVVCIADNASTKSADRKRLKGISLPHTVTCQLQNNGGYAKGNNQAIDLLLKSYAPQYLVVMNPDVLLLEKGTIEGLIDGFEKEHAVGGQPLVWNCYYGDNPTTQQNIRKVPDYKDLRILMLKPLRLFHNKRYRELVYADQMPYKEHIRYYVPSGAFFILRTDVFKDIGFFDEHTFLYYEEQILGYKLQQKGLELLFMPEYKVRHEHGKSTGANRFKFNEKASNIGMESALYYAEKYVGINNRQKRHLVFLHSINNLMMRLLIRIKEKTALTKQG